MLRFPLTRTPADAPVAASLSWSVGGGTRHRGPGLRDEQRVAHAPAARRGRDRHPDHGRRRLRGRRDRRRPAHRRLRGDLGVAEATGTIRDDDTAPPVPTPSATPLPDPVVVAPPPAAPRTPPPTTPAGPQRAADRDPRAARGQEVREPPQVPHHDQGPARREGQDRRGAWSTTSGSSRSRARRSTAPVDLRGLPKGQFTVKVTMTTASGKTLVQTRRYKTCAPKRRG